ncbi:MAG: FAD-dependent thymidylate synthase [Sphingomonadales bacterium]|nr:FAD-dependent thymidylate synthase [Sphingomonadales bacterium]
MAAARTCYSPRVIGTDEITDKQRDSIGPLTFVGGHHTVFQHAHFEFGLENVSRQFVWSFLHSHPFYNSEQSSQRYVKLNARFHLLLNKLAKSRALETAIAQVEALPFASPSAFVLAQAELPESHRTLYVAQVQHRGILGQTHRVVKG